MRIIPAIDIIDGKCVRLTKGDYSTKKIYNENPTEIAKAFQDVGIQYLHLVDLDGAKSENIKNLNILEKIVSSTDLKVDFGGGIKSDNSIEQAFNAGANQITGGSIAIKNKHLFESWINKYSNDKIILGADCINRKIATQGWLETSEIDIIDFIKSYQNIKYIICTDISKDGMLQGISTELYKEIISKTNINLIASGGVCSIDDLNQAKSIGCEAIIIGKAIYEGNISLKDIQNFILNK